MSYKIHVGSVCLPAASALTLAGGAALAISLTSVAEAAEPLVLEEVLVTAPKREVELQAIPLSITAITGADADDRGALRIRDLQNAVPNVVFPFTENHSLTRISIRCIDSQPRANVGTEAGIGMYVGDRILG